MAETGYQLKGNAAQLYEQNNVPGLLRAQAGAMFDQVSLQEGDRMLDVACGTGIVTRVAVERCSRLASIVGLDFNAGMLEVAQANMPKTDTPVEWQEGDMCALPFPDNAFDIVLCQQGIQFAPDKLAALRHIRRVLAPGGRLAFTVWSQPLPISGVLADAVGRYVNDEARTNILLPFAWSDPEVMRELVDEAGFQAIQIEIIESPMQWPSREDEMADYVAVNAARTPFTREITEARTVIIEEMRAALEPYLEGDEFVMPARSHLVQARAE